AFHELTGRPYHNRKWAVKIRIEWRTDVRRAAAPVRAGFSGHGSGHDSGHDRRALIGSDTPRARRPSRRRALEAERPAGGLYRSAVATELRARPAVGELRWRGGRDDSYGR